MSAWLPGLVRISPFTYTLTADQASWDKFAASDPRAHSLWGHSDHAKMTITVDPSMCRDQMADTVLHEVIHCVLEQGVEVGKISTSNVEDFEEYLVRRLTPRLLAVLQDNPALVDWLLDR